jgi:hypothetical protein
MAIALATSYAPRSRAASPPPVAIPSGLGALLAKANGAPLTYRRPV